MAVVDSRARVIGVDGVRVVDASSFALLPPGHPQSTVCKFVELFMSRVRVYVCLRAKTDVLAEKIAADILAGA